MLIQLGRKSFLISSQSPDSIKTPGSLINWERRRKSFNRRTWSSPVSLAVYPSWNCGRASQLSTIPISSTQPQREVPYSRRPEMRQELGWVSLRLIQIFFLLAWALQTAKRAAWWSVILKNNKRQIFSITTELFMPHHLAVRLGNCFIFIAPMGGWKTMEDKKTDSAIRDWKPSSAFGSKSLKWNTHLKEIRVLLVLMLLAKL